MSISHSLTSSLYYDNQERQHFELSSFITCRLIKKILPVAAALLVFLSIQCSSSRTLTDAEKAKLDTPLLHVLDGTVFDGNLVKGTPRADGSREYAVIVRSDHPEDIQALGIPVSSIFGDVIVVHATKEELKKIVSLPSVRAMETGSKRTIQQLH
jgi:hypothetical protein